MATTQPHATKVWSLPVIKIVSRHEDFQSKSAPAIVTNRHSFSIAVGGMIAMAAAMGIGRFVYTPILPFMEAALELSKSDAGLIATANFAGYLAGALLASSPVLKGSRRLWCIGMLALSAVPTGMMAATVSVEFFMALRFAGGFASAFVLVFGSALVLESLAQHQKTGLSALHFGGVGIGIAFSAVLVAQIDVLGFDWRAQWLACAFVTLVAAIAVMVLIKPEMDAETPRANKGDNSPAQIQAQNQSAPRLWPLVLAYGLFGFGYVITATFISTMVRTQSEIQFLEPYIWLIVGLSGVPSVFIWTSVAERFGTSQGFAMACLVEAIAVALSVLATGPVAMVTAAIFLGGTFMGITALGLMRAREINTGDARRMLGLMTAAFGVGQMIGPVFAGYAWQFGNSFVFPSMTAALGLAIAAALTIKPGKPIKTGHPKAS
jgi:predicted MFS family arabinose efflux permease